MKIMKKVVNLFNVILIIVSVLYSLETFKNGDIYNTLIRLSIIPVLYIPFLLRKGNIYFSDSSILAYSIFIFIGHFLGSIIGFYGKVPHYDTLMHTMFGFLGSFIVLEILVKNTDMKVSKILFNSLLIISIISFLSVLWETFEFVCDKLFMKNAQRVLQTGVDDTMKDMIVACIGSLCFCLLYLYETIKEKNIFIKPFIKSLK